MTNNDVLRRIRFIFDFNNLRMDEIFGLADCEVTPEQAGAWLKKEDEMGYQECSDTQLSIFLNGLIVDMRGKKEGVQPEPDKTITNNIIFRKLKIALDLQADDILAMMDVSEMSMSKHELSALFRKPGHKHHRKCKDEVLVNFLDGMQLKYREE